MTYPSTDTYPGLLDIPPVAYTVTVADMLPPKRTDGEAFHTAVLEEAATATGPWGDIDVFTLSPLDSDPSQPRRRTFTTERAQLSDGYYRVKWVDADGDESPPSDPIRTPRPWEPTPDDVAALLRARLRTAGGQVPESFTTDTSPTEEQVFRYIAMQAPLVMIDVGDLSDDALKCATAQDVRDAVRTLIAQRAAAAIELAYWPDSVVNSGPAAGDYWSQVVEIDQPRVVAAARECRLGEIEPGDEQQAATSPSYQFDVYGGETLADRFVKPMNRRW